MMWSRPQNLLPELFYCFIGELGAMGWAVPRSAKGGADADRDDQDDKRRHHGLDRVAQHAVQARKTIAVQREGERGHGTEDYCDRDPDPRTEFQGAKPAANRYGRNGSLMATYKRKDAERADKNGSQNGHP